MGNFTCFALLRIACARSIWKQSSNVLPATTSCSTCNLQLELLRSHLINGRDRVAVDFWLGYGRDEETYPKRSATEEQRNQSQKATLSAVPMHFSVLLRRC